MIFPKRCTNASSQKSTPVLTNYDFLRDGVLCLFPLLPRHATERMVIMKKALVLVALLSVSTFSPVVASAAEHTSAVPIETSSIASNVEVNSSTFPDAYFEVNPVSISCVPSSNEGGTVVGAVSVTAYYEEEYDKVGDSVVCTSSRLLSYDEVMEIGVSEFTESRLPPIDSDTAARGTLDLLFLVTRFDSGTSNVSYELSGQAHWNPVGFDNGSTCPALGEDFVGFVWGGGFDYRDDDARALTNIGLNRNVYFVDDHPNKGIVWSFDEGFEGSSGVDYLSELYASTDIFKNNLTGGGNTTSVSFQYTHTYQAYSGSVSVSFSSTGVTPSFTISPIPANWKISAKVTGLKY